MTYAKIEARIEPAGIRVRLYMTDYGNGHRTQDDFLYDFYPEDGHQPGTVQERVARTFGVAISAVEIVTEFSKE